tara:strand:- start:73573 stop:73851 length:279 start_codon:yes stop_codon:yes gene_type:complete
MTEKHDKYKELTAESRKIMDKTTPLTVANLNISKIIMNMAVTEFFDKLPEDSEILTRYKRLIHSHQVNRTEYKRLSVRRDEIVEELKSLKDS